MSTSGAGPHEPVNRRILVVDDDPTLTEVVRTYLVQVGFIVDLARDGFSAIALAEQNQPDLILLDRKLPGLDGTEVCRRLRLTMNTPIIILTALSAEDDRIQGLEMGADDYITKPFSLRELVLRVQAVLRRSYGEAGPEPRISLGSFDIDVVARVAAHRDRTLSLTGREFDLLVFLLRHPDQVFSRADLMRTVWGWDFGDLSTVTTHVRRLREKIEHDPLHPHLIKTAWGLGYRLESAALTTPLPPKD